jgi:hypothetical protein
MTTESGLSEGCETTLAVWDMCAIPNEDGITSNVINDDGEFMLTVSKDISQADLLAMLRYGEHRYKGGLQRGKEELAASLRALIGAAGRDDE